jgi:hypothetical protein
LVADRSLIPPPASCVGDDIQTITVNVIGRQEVLVLLAHRLYASAMLTKRTLPARFIAPCLPMKAPQPSGPLWPVNAKRPLPCKKSGKYQVIKMAAKGWPASRHPATVSEMMFY